MTEDRNSHTGDLIDIITTDHRDIERAFGEFAGGGMSGERRRELVDHIITELVRHSVAEEQYLYPAARERLGEGDRAADHGIREHTEIETLMKDLEKLGPHDPGFEEKANELIARVRQHVREEESELLPRVRDACSRAELQDLGKKITMAKSSAPTRPHPSAPDRPPADLILDPGVGMIDRLRDVLTGRRR